MSERLSAEGGGQCSEWLDTCLITCKSKWYGSPESKVPMQEVNQLVAPQSRGIYKRGS